ncbi:PREDICTED: membrane-spanning 4-domains subfamily A member 5 [Elephantulus edwardii]|uniref:membrane-spanning 4-domains subfamily A member 5 n=1 Tax=Elephantulus edwardii TaxID=28737 RepID=UPI0003F09262|nr:PREDICTED: membrane-spanning 4-domains subfamily A member 5 [Elephantulus edwardii]
MNTRSAENPVVLPLEVHLSNLQKAKKPFVPTNAFSKALASKLKIFGTIQILFGLMDFSFGMILLFTFVKPYPRFPLIFISGYPFWSSVLFINSGAILIALKRETTKILTKLSQVMNFLSAVGAAIGIVFLSMGFLLDQNYLCGFSNEPPQCHAVTTLFTGIMVILSIFAVTEFLIALCFSFLTCQ